MTAYSFNTKAVALVDETVALRRCALYRDAFRNTAISYPAALLKFNAVANWIRRNRVAVDVTTAREYTLAVSAEVDPLRIVLHQRDQNASPISRAVKVGFGTLVVNSSQQIATLVRNSEHSQRVCIDATTDSADGLASEILAHKRINLVGLHCRLDDPYDPIGAFKLRRLIGMMSRIGREQGIVLTRVSLLDLDLGARCPEPRILRRVREAMEVVIGEACARYRHPRPELTVSPARAALLPAYRASAATASFAV